MKPLFIPLRKHWFEAFASGEKNCEWRPYGPRWNERTLIEGRDVVISSGYSGARLSKRILTWIRVPATQAPHEVRDIYPDVAQFVAIELA